MSITLPLNQIQNIARQADIGVDDEDYRGYDGERRGYLYLAYSGRGMYGSHCLGVVGNAGDFAKFVRAVSSDYDADPSDWPEGFDPDDLLDPSQDSMGLDSIFYWRGIKVDVTSCEECGEYSYRCECDEES